MGIRFLMVAVLAFAFSGCATTSRTAVAPNALQTQMTELQQRMEDQEKEIVDLKYEVKEISSKNADTSFDEPAVPAAPVPVRSDFGKTAEPKNLDIIRVGVSGYELQKALKLAGVYEGKVDGKVGPKTKAAVVEFQKAHSLKADGIVGQKTWNELKAYLNSSASDDESSEGTVQKKK